MAIQRELSNMLNGERFWRELLDDSVWAFVTRVEFVSRGERFDQDDIIDVVCWIGAVCVVPLFVSLLVVDDGLSCSLVQPFQKFFEFLRVFQVVE